MFKIENTTIHLTRGDRCSISFSIEDYEFQAGDIVEFRVYNKKGLNTNPLIAKRILVEDSTDNVEIDLTGEDTSIEEMVNKPITCWYEIELNDSTTVIGYDEDGAKELILYPEGVE